MFEIVFTGTPGYQSRIQSSNKTSGSSERAPRNPAFPTGGGDGGWGGRVVVGLGATRARPSRCAPRDGVLGIVALVWHQCCGITCGRTPRRVPVRHTPGAATAAPSSIELLNWRTRPPISATPCVMCVMAATRRSDARTEVTSEVTQHRNVMRTSCAEARRLPSGAVRVRLVVGRDGRRQGFRARAAPGPRSRVRVLPAGRLGLRGSGYAIV